MINFLDSVNNELKEYITNNIFPAYSKNEIAHGIEHINTVIRRSFELIKQNNLEVNYDIVYAVASYHDIGHHIDRKRHEIVSAEIMSEDKNLSRFFSKDELNIIKEAIEDHRASAKTEPRSIYGKIVSSADRNNTIEECLERPYYYAKKQKPEATDKELFHDSFIHLNLKFGENGYAKFYLKDEEYEKFLNDLRTLLKDENNFYKVQEAHIRKIENR